MHKIIIKPQGKQSQNFPKQKFDQKDKEGLNIFGFGKTNFWRVINLGFYESFNHPHVMFI